MYTNSACLNRVYSKPVHFHVTLPSYLLKLQSQVFNLFSFPSQKLRTTGVVTKPGSDKAGTSFFRRISITLRWWLECNSLEKVGLQAGRYSGTSRPDL